MTEPSSLDQLLAEARAARAEQAEQAAAAAAWWADFADRRARRAWNAGLADLEEVAARLLGPVAFDRVAVRAGWGALPWGKVGPVWLALRASDPPMALLAAPVCAWCGDPADTSLVAVRGLIDLAELVEAAERRVTAEPDRCRAHQYTAGDPPAGGAGPGKEADDDAGA